MPQKPYEEIIATFAERTVGVIGDMMLDIYVLGKPARLSREAPVVVIEFEHEDVRPGGAANAVGNIRSLGANVEALGLIGDDDYGRKLREILAVSGAGTGGLLVAIGQQTITKTRVLAGDIHTVKQQVLRIDRGRPARPGPQLVQSVLENISRAGTGVDCWLVSDYGYGFICQEVENRLVELAASVPVVADSRYRVKEFSRITAVTPNEGEALNFGRYYLNDETDLLVIGQQMLEILFLKCALITRGNEGMIVFERGNKPVTIPVVGSKEIIDVSGAGDTVVATFGLALACGASPEQAARLANCAASVVVMKSGTATCSREELIDVTERYL
jgi:rfaE bifunctional protein kinase chain/domain